MAIEISCAQELIQNAPIAAIIGTRLYPVTLPETPEYPAVTYQAISGLTATCLDSAQTGVKRVQYCAYSPSYVLAKGAAEAITDVLDGFTGALPDGALVVSSVKSLELDEFMEYARVFRVLVEFVIEYE